MSEKLRPEDYTIAWICPLEIVHCAAVMMLDDQHDQLNATPPEYDEVFTFGRIAACYIVIVGLPQTGKDNSLTTLVSWIAKSFPNLECGILISSSGGMPTVSGAGVIGLGDLVISNGSDDHPAVEQYHMHNVGEEEWTTVSFVSPPPWVLDAVQELRSDREESQGDPVQESVKTTNTSVEECRRYRYPGAVPLDSEKGNFIPPIVVHNAFMRSGELVVEDEATGDERGNTDTPFCDETLVSFVEFPCLIIQGSSKDNSSHEDGTWEGFAAARAVSYARQLCKRLPDVESERHANH
jgi:hypothetical protein